MADIFTQRVVDLYMTPLSIRKVAHLTGANYTAIRSTLVAAGVELRQRGGSYPALEGHEERRVVSLYKRGMGGPALAREYETTTTTIYRILTKYGVERRSPEETRSMA